MRAVLCLAFATTVGGADDPEKDAACLNWSEMARSVMTSRQSGTSAPDAMAYYLGQSRPEVHGAYRELIVAAYQHSRWQTEAVRLEAVADFADEAWAACMVQPSPEPASQ